MRICEDPRHEQVCFPDACVACQEECDPRFWRDVDSNPNCVCPQCGAYDETSFDIGLKDGAEGVWGECEACGYCWFQIHNLNHPSRKEDS